MGIFRLTTDPHMDLQVLHGLIKPILQVRFMEMTFAVRND